MLLLNHIYIIYKNNKFTTYYENVQLYIYNNNNNGVIFQIMLKMEQYKIKRLTISSIANINDDAKNTFRMC